MSAIAFVIASLAGGVGAALRLVIDGLIRAITRGRFPTATVLINLTGSFALGLLTGLADTRLLPEEWHLILGGGLLGGYTTFSTASFETVRLLQERRWAAGFGNGLAVLVVAVAGAAAGYAIGVNL